MDKQAMQQKKTNQTGKAKKKSLKVVYIANPMKVKANTSEFRALVQELTGRNADPSKYTPTTEDVGDFAELPEQTTASTSLASLSETAPTGTVMEDGSKSDRCASGVIDDEEVSTPQMIDNYSVFSPTTMFGDLHDYGHGKI